MITPFDDYPIHQTADPVAHPASGDPNHYDRYFFNGFARDGRVFFGGAMAHYPNRGILDAAFSVVSDGVQRSVFASGAMPMDRATSIGPITVEVLEPLRRIRLALGPNDFGMGADLTFEARTVVIEEPRNTILSGARRVMDVTRLTQWGSWSGTISVEGAALDLSAGMYGVRDRSWGQRGVGVQVPTNFPPALPQIFWMWAPLHFERCCTHLALFEHADGNRWLEQALVVPVLGPGEPTWGTEAGVEHLKGVDYRIEWEPGTRVARSTSLTLHSARSGDSRIDLEPVFTFRMRGIGYTHPEFGHGSIHGELTVAGESSRLEDFDPEEPSAIHVQTLCRARWGDEVGIGVLEQACFGDHEPTGLKGLIDGYRG